MTFQNARLDGVALDRCVRFDLDFQRSATDFGRPNSLTEPGAAVLEREVTDGGKVIGFDLATNEDGARRFVDFSIEQASNGEVIYAHKLTGAFVSRWRFETRETRDAANRRIVRYVERIELAFGNYSGNAGGQQASFTLKKFKP